MYVYTKQMLAALCGEAEVQQLNNAYVWTV